MSYSKEDAAHAIEILHENIKPGDTVYTSLRQVASNGMSRHIEVMVPRKRADGSLYIRNITSLVGRAAGFKVSPKTDALVVGGAGMDMGFHVVYSLSSAMFRDGVKCTGKGCPSNDHSNDYGRLSRLYDGEHAAEKDAMEAGERYPRTPEQQKAVESYVSARQTWIAEQEPKLRSRKRIHKDGGYALSQSWI